ncbi:hypothetical protein EDB89DRAFT_2235535 [Lactarius sanguifluus]|nr:hypothetical protein EDB89DRAFT_2235535 [Lactarius sanguifluus]
MAHSIRRPPLTSNRRLAVWLTLWEGSLLQIFSLGDAVPDGQPGNVEVKKGRGDVEVSFLVTLRFMANGKGTTTARLGMTKLQRPFE